MVAPSPRAAPATAPALVHPPPCRRRMHEQAPPCLAGGSSRCFPRPPRATCAGRKPACRRGPRVKVRRSVALRTEARSGQWRLPAHGARGRAGEVLYSLPAGQERVEVQGHYFRRHCVLSRRASSGRPRGGRVPFPSPREDTIPPRRRQTLAALSGQYHAAAASHRAVCAPVPPSSLQLPPTGGALNQKPLTTWCAFAIVTAGGTGQARVGVALHGRGPRRWQAFVWHQARSSSPRGPRGSQRGRHLLAESGLQRPSAAPLQAKVSARRENGHSGGRRLEPGGVLRRRGLHVWFRRHEQAGTLCAPQAQGHPRPPLHRAAVHGCTLKTVLPHPRRRVPSATESHRDAPALQEGGHNQIGDAKAYPPSDLGRQVVAGRLT